MFLRDRHLKNKRDGWAIAPDNYRGNHFATFPKKLVKTCILAGCRENGVVLDPFFGSGTTGVVSRQLNRQFIGIELNSDYISLAQDRLVKESGQLELSLKA